MPSATLSYQLAQVLAGLSHHSDATESTFHHVTISTEIISRSYAHSFPCLPALTEINYKCEFLSL